MILSRRHGEHGGEEPQRDEKCFRSPISDFILFSPGVAMKWAFELFNKN
jgi:hypothetical protein